MPPITPRILVFDSGLGGLSVTREIRKQVPQAQILYYADSAFFPYGTRDEHILIERVLNQVSWLEHNHRPQLIVVACNTASTLVLPRLRAQTRTPIVGVVPAVKPAAELTASGVIGLLATPGTVMRSYTAMLIEQFAGHCEVVSVGSAELVEVAEGKLLGRPVDYDSLHSILAPFRQHPRHHDIDTVALACTHFPLLREELSAAYGRPVHWLDSGSAIAQRVASLLQREYDLLTLPAASGHLALFSAVPKEMEQLRPWLQELDIAPQLSPESSASR